jgi:hypothetical protein
VPPPFAPTHAWACPIWRWFHGQLTSPGATIFDSAHTTHWATTTVLYVANSWSAPISIHVDCYLSDGTPETGVTVSGSVGARQRLKTSLNPTRAPATVSASGDFTDGGEGWFQLWANGPVTPAAMTLVIFSVPGWSPMELIVPVEPVEIEPAAVDVAPPHVEVEAAPEGGGGAAEGTLETHLSVPEAVAWFESARTGRRFHRRDE